MNTLKFGERLKTLRKSKNMTQTQLAARMHVAKSVVSYYELGERSPSPDVLVRMSRIFHVTTDYLLGLERTHMLDVSDLSDEDIAVVEMVADALRRKNQK